MRSRCVGTFVRIITFLAAALPAAAQLSNSSLNGAYNFRYLGVTVAPCDCPVSFIGTVTFDGNGGFKISGQGNYVNSSGTTQTLTPAASGTYTVFSSGMFYMDNPFAAAGSNTLLYGGIGQSGAGQSAVVASSTESENLDTFFAMPAATSASNATLSGTYQVGSLEFAGGTIGGSRQTFFNMASDGKGGLGTVTINGTSLALNNAATTQTSAGATYSVTANGSGTMTFPAPSGVSAANQLLSGAKNLYVSTDGNWFVAGTPTGYDVVVGIKAMPAGSPNPPLKGIYFFSELENYAIGGSAAGVYAYQGSTNELGDSAGTELAHLRVDSDLSYPYDQTSSYTYTFNSSGVATYTGLNLAAGGNGSLYLVAGGAGDYYVSLGIQVQAI
ncbi:MAG TPA: hypothetical protein VGS58_04845, partial [Candidatus Sulfopaludibacter sp.]|nr:hypothetical protein [Candidatus Sulfopaludibacter sp.]